MKERGIGVDADAPLADVLRRHRFLSPPAFKAAVGERDPIPGECACAARQIPLAGSVVTSEREEMVSIWWHGKAFTCIAYK